MAYFALGGPNLGKGAYNGISIKPSLNVDRSSEFASTRSILRNAWNGQGAAGTINGYQRVCTPFRAVNNSGDFLGRVNYSCGGPAPINASKPGMSSIIGRIPNNCDGTGVPAGSCNPRFVADSSDYIRFKKDMAKNHTYNDIGYGGNTKDMYIALKRVRV